jgi:hypothetical protein
MKEGLSISITSSFVSGRETGAEDDNENALKFENQFS